MASEIPVGPRSLVGYRFLRALQNDPVPFLTSVARDHGDIVQFRIGRQVIILLNHPDLIRELLVTQHRSFRKSDGRERGDLA